MVPRVRVCCKLQEKQGRSVNIHLTKSNQSLTLRFCATSHDLQHTREFDATARRSLRKRMRYSFIYTHKPVLDETSYRSFDTMAEYPEVTQQCSLSLPDIFLEAADLH